MIYLASTYLRLDLSLFPLCKLRRARGRRGRTHRKHTRTCAQSSNENAYQEPINPIFLPLRGHGVGVYPPPQFATPSRTYVPVGPDPSGYANITFLPIINILHESYGKDDILWATGTAPYQTGWVRKVLRPRSQRRPWLVQGPMMTYYTVNCRANY